MALYYFKANEIAKQNQDYMENYTRYVLDLRKCLYGYRKSVFNFTKRKHCYCDYFDNSFVDGNKSIKSFGATQKENEAKQLEHIAYIGSKAGEFV